MRLTAQDLKKLGVIDAIIPEPMGGAHRAPEAAMNKVGDEIGKQLDALKDLDGGQLRTNRREKFLAMGKVGLS